VQAYRKSLVQVRFRLRQDLLRRVEGAAKHNDRSTNDEVERRLEESFEGERWQKEHAELRRDRDHFLQMFKLLLHVKPSREQRASILEGIEAIERDWMSKPLVGQEPEQPVPETAKDKHRQ
jgi:hypothetical protein